MGMGKSLRFAERPLRLRTSFGNSFWLGLGGQLDPDRSS